MICIPFIVNGSAHVAQLHESSNQNETRPNYILERDKNQDVITLCSFESGVRAFFPDLGMKTNGRDTDYWEDTEMLNCGIKMRFSRLI